MATCPNTLDYGVTVIKDALITEAQIREMAPASVALKRLPPSEARAALKPGNLAWVYNMISGGRAGIEAGYVNVEVTSVKNGCYEGKVLGGDGATVEFGPESVLMLGGPSKVFQVLTWVGFLGLLGGLAYFTQKKR
jgi:hypothetical protein